MSEDKSTEYYLDAIFEKFERSERKLGKLATKIARSITNMLAWTRQKGEAIFDDETALYGHLDAIKQVTPHTDHLVLYIDHWHKLLSQPEVLAEQAMKRAAESSTDRELRGTQADVGQSGSPGGEYGFFRYMGERKKADTMMKIAQLRTQPQVTTTSRQADFINYAKDIPPELNKLYDWLPRVFLRMQMFKDAESKKAFYTIFRIYIEKVSSLIMGFSGAILELRKELVGERQLAHANALAMMKQAEYGALGGMRVSDFYRAVKEAAGPENAAG